jgi:hypothetical protein
MEISVVIPQKIKKRALKCSVYTTPGYILKELKPAYSRDVYCPCLLWQEPSYGINLGAYQQMNG